MELAQEQIQAALKDVVDPLTGKDFVSARCIKKIEIDGDKVAVAIEVGYPVNTCEAALRTQVADAVSKVAGVGSVSVAVSGRVVAHAVQQGVKLLEGVKNIIAVASGKGGVGKSTTTANLALALAAAGAKVGVLDADIYGPSQPQMLGLEGRNPTSPDGKTMDPLESFGIQVMSIGFMIDADTPMVWRGPMATQALKQLLTETNWAELDYLLIDMPPGTGDIQLTLSQTVPLTGSVIVTTPQDIALLDARKGVKMFEKVGVPILGVVENMSIHVCPNCGHESHIFGAGGGQKMCQDFGVEYLGALPLELRIREEADAGRPTVVADPESKEAALYMDIAMKVAGKVASRAKDMSHKFPSIVVQNT
ncbi:iron-sulfur cluster carrier protein ApbC [Nitrogeniibacter aestuarii]|uniref:iron-sulfur cluster carrier protein ApbC n=1 Tax=Nitrogeniibacter aestuarii TaxID=2815343 RepID=UPI001D0F6B6E|nr:iron-sulfur cluster carrier protein ApbC [Nitrogeniibacter aestuarii]